MSEFKNKIHELEYEIENLGGGDSFFDYIYNRGSLPGFHLVFLCFQFKMERYAETRIY